MRGLAGGRLNQEVLWKFLDLLECLKTDPVADRWVFELMGRMPMGGPMTTRRVVDGACVGIRHYRSSGSGLITFTICSAATVSIR